MNRMSEFAQNAAIVVWGLFGMTRMGIFGTTDVRIFADDTAMTVTNRFLYHTAEYRMAGRPDDEILSVWSFCPIRYDHTMGKRLKN